MVDLELDGVSKTFATGVPALQDIALTVARGQCLALVGPSGCGKTTLLRVIAGLESASEGVIKIGGAVVNDVACHRRGVAMLFQRPALIPAHTVRQNLLWISTLREPWTMVFGTSRARAEQLTHVARMLELERDLEHPVQQLSGGQQQRVALGRCLLEQAKICLLDEPLGHLDAPLRVELRRQIHALARTQGITVIHVTHDPEEALAVGDRVAVMQAGRIVQVDEPEALRRSPAHRLVAELVHHGGGGLNLVAGHICRDGMDLYFENVFGRWPISIGVLNTLRESLYKSANIDASKEKVHSIMGIGVCDVRCTTDPRTEDGEVSLPLPVREAEESGSGRVTVVAEDPRGRWIGRATERFQPGQHVMMMFSMQRAMWFDSATGRTLCAPTG